MTSLLLCALGRFRFGYVEHRYQTEIWFWKINKLPSNDNQPPTITQQLNLFGKTQ